MREHDRESPPLRDYVHVSDSVTNPISGASSGPVVHLRGVPVGTFIIIDATFLITFKASERCLWACVLLWAAVGCWRSRRLTLCSLLKTEQKANTSEVENQCERVRAFVMHVDQTDTECKSITSYTFKYVFLCLMPSQAVNISRNIHGRVL